MPATCNSQKERTKGSFNKDGTNKSPEKVVCGNEGGKQRERQVG